MRSEKGIKRKIDELGRIVIPIEMRRDLDIYEDDYVEIIPDGNEIILRKYVSGDIFDGTTEDLIDYYGKKVSKKSIIEMAKLIGLRIDE